MPKPVELHVSGPLTKLTPAITMSGASAALVGASAGRKAVYVCSADSNDPAAVDPTGGTCALDSGVPLAGGGMLVFTGDAAKSAMTQIGTTGQKLTVFVGS